MGAIGLCELCLDRDLTSMPGFVPEIDRIAGRFYSYKMIEGDVLYKMIDGDLFRQLFIAKVGPQPA